MYEDGRAWSLVGEPPVGADQIAAVLAQLSGVDLACTLASLPEPGEVDAFTLVELAAGWEKVARFARAQVLCAVAELATLREVPPPGGVGEEDPRGRRVAQFAASEVALALGTSHAVADGLLADALTLTTRLPQVLGALAAGRVHERAAHVLAEVTLGLPVAAAGQVADAILAKDTLKTVSQIRAAARAAVTRIDPAGAAAREVKAVRGRFIAPHKDIQDGMVAWQAWLPITDSIAIWDRLCELGKGTKGLPRSGEYRSLDARRADAAVNLLLGRPVNTPDGRDLGDGGRPTSRVWRTDVIVAASTLAGHDEHPGRVPGWGTITAGTARRLAAGLGRNAGPAGALAQDAQWRRILTDPDSGLVKDYGTTRYRPPAALADYLRARDTRCYEPYCQRSAWHGDLDHIRNSPAGPSPRPDPNGRTAATNFGAGCARGHATKAAPGWHVETPSEGTFIWTTPTGHQYTRHPEPPIDWYLDGDLEPAQALPQKPPDSAEAGRPTDDHINDDPPEDLPPPF